MIERIYRVMLALCPREFSDRFGDDMRAAAREQVRRRGSSPAAVVAAAVDALKTLILIRHDIRTEERKLVPATRRESMETVLQDIRFAVRGLRRDPLFTLFVVAILTLGIGVNATMFGIADRLLIRGPEHVRDAARVVRVYLTGRPRGTREITTSTFGNAEYDLLRSGTHSFERLAAYSINDVVVGYGADARELRGGYASAGLFPMLGVQPARGRFYTEDEDAVSGADHVAVLGYAMWQAQFAGADNAVGRKLRIGDDLYTIVGVAPRGFTGPQFGPVDVWLPMSLLGARTTTNWVTSWNAQWLHIVGRLRPGVTFQQAGEDATFVHRRDYSASKPAVAAARLRVASLAADDSAEEAPEITIVRWLGAVAVLVLLIACANVANLLLARGMRRSREVAVRAALGARRGRLARLLLTEALILSAGGAAAGTGVSFALGRITRRVVFPWVDWSSSPVDLRVLLASACLALLTGIAVGLFPAIRAGRTSLSDGLRTGVREGRGRRATLRNSLTIVQAMLSVVLLVGAVLFVCSLWNAQSLHLGIEPERVLVVNVSRPALARLPAGPVRESERARRRTYSTNAAERLRHIAGVERASVAVGLPFGNQFTVEVRLPGRETLPIPEGGLSVSAVGPDYFRTVGTRIVRGREFGQGDRVGTEPVAIVSDRLARTIWPGEDPLGKCIIPGRDVTACARVVGVAEDTYRNALSEVPPMHCYIPFGHEVGFGGTVLLVRSSKDPRVLASDVRRAIVDLDPSISYVSMETIQERIDPQTKQWKLGATVFSLSAILALVVAAFGMYSVMSYLVADRRHEIGVRIALGAQRADIRRLVLLGSLGMAAVGVGLGIALAMAGSRFIEPLLFRQHARDPVVYAVVGVILLGAAFLAGWIPSTRANRVDPADALRAE